MRVLFAFLLIIFSLVAEGCSEINETQDQTKGLEKMEEDTRPTKWAQPLEKKGLQNLAKVSETLYRGAQPTREGMRALEKMGVRTIFNLRSFHSDRKLLKDTGLAYHHVTMKTWHPERKELLRFLRLINEKSRQPVFVHCMQGSDRTGLICAVYRMVFEGWSADEALREMREAGFGFHELWKNMPRYLRALDVEALRRETGVNAPDSEEE